MANKKKTVEFFQVTFEKEEGAKLNFEDVLLSDTVRDFESYVNGKNVSVRILETGKTIIGIVETIRTDNVPPKKHRKKKKITSLGLEAGEGLCYGNIFLYEKNRRILLYEVNKNGSFAYHFLKCLQYCCAEDDSWSEKFSASLNTILQPDEYKRLNKINYFKTLEITLANPKAIIRELQDEKEDALSKTMNLLQELETDTFIGKYDVKSKKRGGKGLSEWTLKEMIQRARGLLNTEGGSENIRRLVVKGYALDEDDKEILEPVDLIADRFLKEIVIDEPRENIDLLENQRRTQIKELYRKCLPDFKIILGD